MGVIHDSAYTDPDLIQGLYQNPANQVLLAEYILQTGGGGALPTAAAVGGGGGLNLSGGADSGSSGGAPCFVGNSRVVMFNEKQYSLAYLHRFRDHFMHKGVRSFTKDGRIMPGEIIDITKTKVYDLLTVDFPGEQSMEMVKEHRFWTPNGEYESMCHVSRGSRVSTFDEEWKAATVGRKTLRRVSRGVYVYNLSVRHYANYMVTVKGGVPKAVSNRKPEE